MLPRPPRGLRQPGPRRPPPCGKRLAPFWLLLSGEEAAKAPLVGGIGPANSWKGPKGLVLALWPIAQGGALPAPFSSPFKESSHQIIPGGMGGHAMPSAVKRPQEQIRPRPPLGGQFPKQGLVVVAQQGPSDAVIDGPRSRAAPCCKAPGVRTATGHRPCSAMVKALLASRRPGRRDWTRPPSLPSLALGPGESVCDGSRNQNADL